MKITPVYQKFYVTHLQTKNNLSVPISFAGDSFEKEKLENLKQQSVSLQDRLEKLIKITSAKSLSLDEQEKTFFAYQQLIQDYKLINDTLTKSSGKNYEKDSKIILAFLDAMDNMSMDKGFNRISGYDDVKNKLRKEFIISSIMMNRTSQKANVPNAILFYGPSNNGKTTFAHALAEQTLSNINVVDTSRLPEEETIEMLEELVKQSLVNYNNSQDKRRTIILINEAEAISHKSSEVLDRVKKIVKECSDKYKCTLFFTSNNPRLIDKEVLSEMSFKIPIEPANKKTCREIITNKFNMSKITPKGDVDELVNKIFSDCHKTFANGDIVDIIEQTMKKNANPEIKDYIETLENFDKTSISPKSLIKFEEDKKALS